MGLTSKEIARRFDEIVDFSELETALDKPVKQYSSGMQLRLGFSIASHIDPDVFVVDEALAVGDAVFQAKCVERMMQLVARRKTLLFVSHDLTAVESLCRRAVFLLGGRIVADGDVKNVIKRYLAWTQEYRLTRWRRRGHLPASPPETAHAVEIIGATCHDAQGREVSAFTSDEPVHIRVRFRSRQPVRRPHFTIGITDGRPQMLLVCSTLHRGERPAVADGEWTAVCRIERLNLMPRLYHVWCGVNPEYGNVGQLSDWQEITMFRVVPSDDEDDDGSANVSIEALHGAIKSDYCWSYEGAGVSQPREPVDVGPAS
jgi:hypothetical protein